MGIETFFFISLAVTFLLLVALVYHFRQKFIVLDQRVNHIIEIINNVVKEMQNLKVGMQPKCRDCVYSNVLNQEQCINIPSDSFVQSNVILGNMPTELLNIHLKEVDDDDDDDDDNDDDDDDDDDDNDDDVDDDVDDDDNDDVDEKIIVSDDEEEDEIVLDENDILKIVQDSTITEETVDETSNLESSLELSPEISIISNTDYKKMDISQLRIIALNKGIDAKKMKKADIIKLLE